MRLLKPERTRFGKVFEERKESRLFGSSGTYEQITNEYDLIRVSRESNPGHGVHKVIESVLGVETIEFRVDI